MPQATRRWISEKVKSLNESNVLPFHDILDAEMANSALASTGVTFKERIYTPFVTLSMFLSQVLDRMALGFPLSRLHQAFARVLARFHKKLLWFRSALVGARFDAAEAVADVVSRDCSEHLLRGTSLPVGRAGPRAG